MHVFPQLRKLEDKYRAELAVVGVHSAKFDAERSTANVRQAVLRYGIEHPVVNDAGFDIWRSYTVRAWPTLMFIDPEGKVIGKHEGEITFDAFDGVLAEMVRQFDERGLIDRRPLSFVSEREKESGAPLSFPGKVLADPTGDRLFIADSNHHRVVVASTGGQVRDVIGCGEAGPADGAFGEAQFDDPHGLALVDGDTLYVADAGNHAIRRVELANQNVKTIAGTGEQATGFHRGGTPALR
jgi:thiol-disulfide isomerase/thioredoxin